MKKIIVTLLCISLLAIMLTGCGSQKKQNEPQKDVQPSQSDEIDQSDRENASAGIVYKVPADAVQIDLSASNPSNDRMQFSFDEDNRVSQCRYIYEGQDIRLVYTYSDSQVQIYGFSGEYVVADETFEISKYDKMIGMVSYEGYYFSGCEF